MQIYHMCKLTMLSGSVIRLLWFWCDEFFVDASEARDDHD